VTGTRHCTFKKSLEAKSTASEISGSLDIAALLLNFLAI